MTHHLSGHRNGFEWGWTYLTRDDEAEDNTGITFSILRLRKGESECLPDDKELALLHLEGEIRCVVGGETVDNRRDSLFDESPFSIHVPKGAVVEVNAVADSEIAVFQTPNNAIFPPVIYRPENTANEHRGKGLVQDASLRFVRTIFDGRNSHPNTQLVLGEVVNFPGRWSSYPPHHHPQPEIYHYRFTRPNGYGHSELGEQVVRVRQYDTIKILDEVDHAQCAAPGYGMYYIWVIRHLEGARYTVPEFTEEHAWTMEPDAAVWSAAEEVLV